MLLQHGSQPGENAGCATTAGTATAARGIAKDQGHAVPRLKLIQLDGLAVIQTLQLPSTSKPPVLPYPSDQKIYEVGPLVGPYFSGEMRHLSVIEDTAVIT